MYAWYGGITSDRVFVEEVVRVVAHVTRGLEGRIRGVDLGGLVGEEICEVLRGHVRGE